MSLYYAPSTGGWYDTEFADYSSIPTDAIELSLEQWEDLRKELNTEKTLTQTKEGLVWVRSTPDPTQESARLWRNFELNRSDIELYKVQDSDPGSIGTVSDWRNYRRLLRAWPQTAEFPKNESRPVAPDNKGF